MIPKSKVKSMNLPDINRFVTPGRRCRQDHPISFRAPSSSLKISKSSNAFSTLIQLCIQPNESHAVRSMRILFSTRDGYSPNMCDAFGCNILMYAVRYQRYKLFEFLLNETSIDLNLRAKDREGNTILHYASFYSGNNTQIMEQLIEKYNQFAIKIDERNNLGFTSLLLAAFNGRYDLVFILLTRTNASPFVRDYIQLKNMFDYLAIDVQERKTLHTSRVSPEAKQLRDQLHRTIPFEIKTSFHIIEHPTYSNFFETILPSAIARHSELLRSLIREFVDFEYRSMNIGNLSNYLNQRYPRIPIARQQRHVTIRLGFDLRRENSNTNVHNILNLFDPNFRPHVNPPSTPHIPLDQKQTSSTKPQLAFKRLSTKITTLTAFTRTQIGKKRPSIAVNNAK